MMRFYENSIQSTCLQTATVLCQNFRNIISSSLCFVQNCNGNAARDILKMQLQGTMRLNAQAGGAWENSQGWETSLWAALSSEGTAWAAALSSTPSGSDSFVLLRPVNAAPCCGWSALGWAEDSCTAECPLSVLIFYRGHPAGTSTELLFAVSVVSVWAQQGPRGCQVHLTQLFFYPSQKVQKRQTRNITARFSAFLQRVVSQELQQKHKWSIQERERGSSQESCVITTVR